MTEPTSNDEERILLVDDNPLNLQVLMETLQSRESRLLVAKSGETALTISRKTHPDLILLDIMMPGMDGYEVIRQLKAERATADIPVIFLSALDQTGDKVRGLQLGAVDYVTKPCQAEEVLARVDTHLMIHRLRARISAHVQAALPGEAGAFAAAVMTGDRSAMSRDTIAALRGALGAAVPDATGFPVIVPSALARLADLLDPPAGPVAEMHVHNTDTFARLVREGELGFADAYLEEWRKAPPVSVDGDDRVAAEAAAARIEADYDTERLKTLIGNDGRA